MLKIIKKIIPKKIWQILRKVRHLIIKIKNKLIAVILMTGKTKSQRFYESLNKFSLRGMNIGTGGKIEESGEIQVLKYINNYFKSKKKLVVFDVGANIGDYSILLNKIFKKKAKIYSFEPSLKIFKILSKNTGSENNIYLYNFGFGDINKTEILYSNPNRPGLTSIYKRKLDHFNIEMNQTEEIKIKTIDSFCEKKIRHIDFMKLDIEGHEKKALNGAKNMINSGNIDFIQFEFGGCNIDSKTYFQDFYYMLKDKYKIYRVMKDGLYEIKKYKETYEIFITTNYLAEKNKQ